MPKQMPVQFGEWRPDLALLDNQFASEALNVYSGFNSYQPWPSLIPFSNAQLPGPCHGLTAVRLQNGEWVIYAATDIKLYRWHYNGWTDVSRLAGGNYHVDPSDLVSFEQSGPHLVAVNINDPPQVINVDTEANFSALAGSPPRAHSVKQIGDFLVLSGLESNNRMIQWSAINDIGGWTPGTNLSDLQEFPDGGPVKLVAGGEVGYILQDRCIRTMQFLPGDSVYIFNFTRVVQYRGCLSKFGAISVGNTVYFLSEDGFYAIAGNQLNPIGADKVNDWFRANSDYARWDVVQAISFPNKPYIMWAFHASSASQTYDHCLLYNFANQKWTHGTPAAQVWATLGTPALDLDTDGSEPGDPLLDSTAQPLDSFAYVGGRPLVGGVDPNGVLGSLNGPALVATMETAEAHLVPGMRAFVSDVYPMADGDPTAGYVRVATRERLQDPVVWTDPINFEITGSCSVLTSSRLHRFRLVRNSGDSWTHAQGVLVDADKDGEA
jgi:hypothetical protein